MSDDPNRRSFLRWCVHGMGAVFAAVIGVPAVAYLIDPRNRAGGGGAFRPVEGIKLGPLTKAEGPKQGTIRDIRHDAWTLHPNDVIGRVWVARVKDAGEEPDLSKQFMVWTTICPHLGCSINLNDNRETACFKCPCHNAEFDGSGNKVERAGYDNVAPRGMDTLEYEAATDPENPDPSNRDLLRVKYENFEATAPVKKVLV